MCAALPRKKKKNPPLTPPYLFRGNCGVSAMSYFK